MGPVNVPVTVWKPVDGYGDYTSTGVDNIVDTSGYYLVDQAGVFIVDTGLTFTGIPATVWSSNDGE